MNTPTKIAIIIVTILLIVFAGAIGYRLWMGSDQSATPAPLAQLAESLVTVTQPTLEEMLNERTKDCLPEARDAFVTEATRINDSFEDTYLLALSAARITLTPVVQQMQQQARDMEELPADRCGKIVQTQFAVAYDQAIKALLNFMQERTSDIDLYDIAKNLRIATAYLEAYKASPAALVYWQDVEQAILNPTSDAEPDAFDQYAFLAKLSERAQCEQMQPFQAIGSNLFNLVFSDRFSNLDLDLPTSTTSPTKDCSKLSDVPPTSTPIPIPTVLFDTTPTK